MNYNKKLIHEYINTQLLTCMFIITIFNCDHYESILRMELVVQLEFLSYQNTNIMLEKNKQDIRLLYVFCRKRVTYQNTVERN